MPKVDNKMEYDNKCYISIINDNSTILGSIETHICFSDPGDL